MCDALADRFIDRLVAAATDEVVAGGPSRDGLATFFRVTLETIETHRSLFIYVSRGTDADTADRTLHLAGRSAEPFAALLTLWHHGDRR